LCAKLIDTDEARFTIEVLRKWKQDAEERALLDIATEARETYRRPLLVVELDDEDRAFLQSLALPAEDTVEAVLARIRPAAERDIAGFRSTKEWPAHAIALNLTLHANDGRAHAVTIEGLANGLDAAESLNLVSPPGTGKTTTLVQLAGALLQVGHVAVLVPLGEWSDRREDFFTFLMRRNAFRAFRPQHLMQLAYHGRLALLLDGWNELDPASRLAATRYLKALRRDYPLLGIVVGTRRHVLPISGPIVEIEPLSDDQQRELARSLRGQEGEALVDQAWRTSGLRELIGIPLYLTALLRSTPGVRFPQTKEEVLRLFVLQHEQEPEKAAILQKELLGFHSDILIGLAIEANRLASTVLSDTAAHRVIMNIGTQLSNHKQLSVPPQPVTVIDVLVSGHILIRAPSSAGVSFQHQQFQEWYASLDVGRIMQQAAQGNAEARTKLRAEILNWPAWEETILFACERLSRENFAGAQAVAGAIRDTLAIDPMLAAEMICRSASQVWTMIRAEVTSFTARWHAAGKVDRAARFMMTTGRPEFAPQIWPLISCEDTQVYLKALRSPRRFQPSVLGDDAEQILAGLPDETRKHVVAEIAANSGFDGMELAVRVAKADPSADTVLEVLQSLQFRRANRMVAAILKSASEEVWELVARSGYPDELADPAQSIRLADLRRTQLESELDAVKVLDNLATHRLDGAETRIPAIIASPDFPVRNDHAAVTLQRAFDAYPALVRKGLLLRVASRFELPYRTHEFLKGAAAVDEGAVVEAAIDPATPRSVARGSFAIIGPKTVGTLIDRLSALHELYLSDRNAWGRPESQAQRDDYGRIEDAICASRNESFLAALLDRSETDDPVRIEFLADLLARHGRHDDEVERTTIADETRTAIVRTIQRWIDAVLRSPQANRHQCAAVARAAARVPDPQFAAGLQHMVDRDLADWARAREEHARAGGPMSADVMYNHTLEYQKAFAAIGDGETTVSILKGYLADVRFGLNAAGALLEIWNCKHPAGKTPNFMFGRDYSRAKELGKQRRESPQTLPKCDYSEAIFDVVRSIATKQAEQAVQRHALALAVVGLGLPHGTKRTEIDALLAFPVPHAAKQRLLMSVAMAGEIVPADALIAGIDELLEAGKTETWRLAEDRGELMTWVELFAFSDRPEAVLDVLDRLPPQYGYASSLDRLISALAKSPHDEALGVLQALGRHDPKIMARHEWVDALIKLRTEASGRALLALVCDGTLGSGRGFDSFHLSRQLARSGEEFPPLKSEILRRYERMSAGSPKYVLESALIELADAAVVIAIIRGYAADQRPYDGGLSRALRGIALGQRPVEGWVAGAYEEFSVSLAELRRELFAMALAKNAQSALAEKCLVTIDKLRDRYGRIDDEPRHPDIASGQPWPLIRSTGGDDLTLLAESDDDWIG
jgi:hypothetical protein